MAAPVEVAKNPLASRQHGFTLLETITRRLSSDGLSPEDRTLLESRVGRLRSALIKTAPLAPLPQDEILFPKNGSSGETIVVEVTKEPSLAEKISRERAFGESITQAKSRRTNKNDIPTTQDEIEIWYRGQLKMRQKNPNILVPNKNQRAWDVLQMFEHLVLYEDTDVLIFNKPAYINTHHSPQVPMGVEEMVRLERGFAVDSANRLDRDTTGILVFAKTPEAFACLVYQFANKEKTPMRKMYAALLDGELQSDTPIKVAVPIATTSTDRMEVVTTNKNPRIGDARMSYTIFRPTATFETASGLKRTLVEVEILTGITHQIRVVAADYLRHPVIGDRMYKNMTSGIGDAKRPMLHAARLTFEHPTTREVMTITAPIPRDFRKAMEGLHMVEQPAHNGSHTNGLSGK